MKMVSQTSTSAKAKNKSGTTAKKKQFVKNCLDSPFTSEWPAIDPEDYKRLEKLLKVSVSSLNISNFRPSPDTMAKIPKKERKTFRIEFKKKAVSEIDENVLRARKELVIGYNAVMRSIENMGVVMVFVDSLAKPELLVKMFIPACSVRNIPLVPVKGLKTVVAGVDTLGVKSCLALGLKNSVTNNESRFYRLYTASLQALHMKTDEDNEKLQHGENDFEDVSESNSVDTTDERQPSQVKGKSDPSKIGKASPQFDILSSVQIAKYHLPKVSSGMAFVPGVSKSTGGAGDFLPFTNTNKSVNETAKGCKRKRSHKTVESVNTSGLESSMMFALDYEGVVEDDVLTSEDAEAVVVEAKSNEIEESMKREDRKVVAAKEEIKKNAKLLKKRKTESSYKPAKVQRVKGDPERKKKIEKRNLKNKKRKLKKGN